MRYVFTVIATVCVCVTLGKRTRDVPLILTRAYAEDPLELTESSTGPQKLVLPFNITSDSEVEIFATGTMKHSYLGPVKACSFFHSIDPEDKNLVLHGLQAAGLEIECPIQAGARPLRNMTSLTIPYDEATDCFVETLFLGLIVPPHTVLYQATFIYGGEDVNSETCQKMLAAQVQ